MSKINIYHQRFKRMKKITLAILMLFLSSCSKEEKTETKVQPQSSTGSSTHRDGLVYYLTFNNTRSSEIEGLGLKQFESMCQYSITYEDF